MTFKGVKKLSYQEFPFGEYISFYHFNGTDTSNRLVIAHDKPTDKFVILYDKTTNVSYTPNKEEVNAQEN